MNELALYAEPKAFYTGCNQNNACNFCVWHCVFTFFFFKFHLCCYTLQDKNSQKMITRTTQLHRISGELNNSSTTGWEEELNLGDCQPVE